MVTNRSGTSEQVYVCCRKVPNLPVPAPGGLLSRPGKPAISSGPSWATAWIAGPALAAIVFTEIEATLARCLPTSADIASSAATGDEHHQAVALTQNNETVSAGPDGPAA